jgi:DNA-binding response OmpR family regulator
VAAKILCIEDEYFISELYVRALTKAGYEVTVSMSGEDGLAYAQKGGFDVILLDLMIPGLTGMEVLRALRDPAKSPGFNSKIIITTNLVQDDATRAEIEKQADGYLIKADITPRQLVAFVQSIVPATT